MAITFASAMAYCQKNNLTTLELLIPRKDQFKDTMFANIFGESFAKKLAANKPVILNGINISASTSTTIKKIHHKYDVLCILWNNPKYIDMNHIQTYQNPKAIFYVSWLFDEAEQWQKEHNPILLP